MFPQLQSKRALVELNEAHSVYVRGVASRYNM